MRRGQRGIAWPIVDGDVIRDDQYRLYEAGRFNDTPILVGYNSDEGLSFTRVKTADEFIAGVRRALRPLRGPATGRRNLGRASRTSSR